MKLVSRKIVESEGTMYWDMTIPKNHNYVLTNGNVAHNTGVGFSVEEEYVAQLPVVAEEFHETDTTIVVADSKLGWAKAYKELLSLIWQGQIPKWDLSNVRPAGAPLKTFGGRASGPEPLDELFKFTINTFQNSAGRKLKPVEAHDIVCKIAEIVVVGGVRRSALISLSNLQDETMRHAKSGQWWENNPQRALANNSVNYKEKPDIGTFMREWLSLYDSKSGERGIYNSMSARRQVESLNNEEQIRREPRDDFGTNPCCLPGHTEILTNKGYVPIEKIIEDIFQYQVLGYDNDTKEVRFVDIDAGQLTRPNANLIELEIEDDDGEIHTIQLTPDHRVWTENRGYIEAGKLTEDDIVLSTMEKHKVVKGRIRKTTLIANQDTYDIQTQTKNFFARNNGKRAILAHNSEIILRSREFCNLSEVVVRGRDTAESLRKKVRMATILGTFQSTLTSFKYLTREWKRNCDEERLLGVSLTGIMDNALTNGKKKGLENLLENLKKEAVATNKEFAEKLDIPQSAAITCVKPSGCFEKNQKIKSNKGILSLDEIFKMNGIDLSEKENDYREWYEISKELIVYDENNEEQSITKLFVNGVEETIKFTLEDGEIVECTPNHKFKLTNGSWKEAKDLTEDDDMMKIVKKEISKNLTVDIEVSGTHTYQLSNGCIVHNTVSQLVDSASGIHARHNPYYIRTVRADNKDPLCAFMKDAGFPNEADVMKPQHTTVFSFPMQSPKNAVFRQDMTAKEQLELWQKYQTHWCEHKPSVTISVKEHEWMEVGNWVWENFDSISGISFLPFSEFSYRQPPYQDCTKEEYEEAVKAMPKNVDWSQLSKYEEQDFTAGAQELACAADGGCEVVDI